jgi:hypothetical protein
VAAPPRSPATLCWLLAGPPTLRIAHLHLLRCAKHPSPSAHATPPHASPNGGLDRVRACRLVRASVCGTAAVPCRRRYFRTVFDHDRWAAHRSTRRYLRHVLVLQRVGPSCCQR